MELSARELPREPGVDGAEGELAALGAHAQARDVVEQPLELGRGEIRVEDEAGLRLNGLLQTFALQRIAARGGAPVLPDDCAVDGLSRAPVPYDRGLALVGDPDRGDAFGVELGFFQSRARARELRAENFQGVVLDPARLREMLAELLLRQSPRGPALVEHDGAGARGALVEREHVFHSGGAPHWGGAGDSSIASEVFWGLDCHQCAPGGAAEQSVLRIDVEKTSMKIHEYQAKEILRKYGVATPRGVACFSVDEAAKATRDLGGKVWVVKAQIHAGGRGKGGGVKVAKSEGEVREWAGKILGMMLKTHQTGPEGQKVRRLLVEEGADIKNELYVGMVVDRGTQRVALMASSEGGMDIEEVAARAPEKIHKVFIDPGTGLKDAEADGIAKKIGIPAASVPLARIILKGLYKAFDETDSSLAEINPLILTGEGKVVALDAKINFDDNAAFRHPEWQQLRDLDEEDPAEVEASKYDLNYIQLDGDIGCLVNGAGLAMATMDIIKLYGGAPANFLDVGGGATTEKVTEAFKIMLRIPHLKAILVNIFGGIMKCDVIAAGVVAAAKQVSLRVPLVVRLEGTNVDLGKKILAESGLPIISGSNMADAAQKVVAASRGKS